MSLIMRIDQPIRPKADARQTEGCACLCGGKLHLASIIVHRTSAALCLQLMLPYKLKGTESIDSLGEADGP